MATGVRGIMGSYTSGVRQRPDAPRLMQRVERPSSSIAPDAIYHRFITNVSRFHMYKINAIRDDEEDELLTAHILAIPEHFGGVIQFYEYGFATPYNSIALWLDNRIRMGLARGISRDASSIMLRCPKCDVVKPNTPDGVRELVDHQLYDHPADTSAFFFRPVTVGDYTNPGDAPRIATAEELQPAFVVEVDDGLTDAALVGMPEFHLGGVPVPAEIAAEMEAQDGIQSEDTERVSSGQPERRSGGRGRSNPGRDANH